MMTNSTKRSEVACQKWQECVLLFLSFRFHLLLLGVYLQRQRPFLSALGFFCVLLVCEKHCAYFINVTSSRGLREKQSSPLPLRGEFQLSSQTINKTKTHVTRLFSLRPSCCTIHPINSPLSSVSGGPMQWFKKIKVKEGVPTPAVSGWHSNLSFVTRIKKTRH